MYNEENAECFVINIDKIVNVATDKRQKITIKVVAVTEFGEISKVTTLKLKVNPVWYSISLYIPDVPDERYTVSAGGSLQLKAQLIKRTNTQTKVLTLKN